MDLCAGRRSPSRITDGQVAERRLRLRYFRTSAMCQSCATDSTPTVRNEIGIVRNLRKSAEMFVAFQNGTESMKMAPNKGAISLILLSYFGCGDRI
jgi:hypothetical protein